jgi:D-inositol-3-phosphate glycosyltransferase
VSDHVACDHVAYLGELDSPGHGEHVRSDLLRVAGWVLLDARPASRVEVITADAGTVTARIQQPRPDVAQVFPELPHAGTSGYEARLTLDLPPGAERIVVLRVRAWSADGVEWTSPRRVCTVRNPDLDREDHRQAMLVAGHTGELLNAVGRRRVPRRLVVFTHGLGIGGGQLWLQELLTGLVKQHDWTATVISPEDGPLRADCEDLGIGVHITSPYRVGSATSYEGHVTELALLAASSGASVALVNTLGVFAAADAAQRAGLPTSWVLHESFTLADFGYLNWGPAGLPASVRLRWENALARADPGCGLGLRR